MHIWKAVAILMSYNFISTRTFLCLLIIYPLSSGGAVLLYPSARPQNDVWGLWTFFFVALAHHSSLLRSFWILSTNIARPVSLSLMSSANLISKTCACPFRIWPCQKAPWAVELMSIDTSSISFSLESFVIVVTILAVPRCQGCLSAKPHMHCFPLLVHNCI